MTFASCRYYYSGNNYPNSYIDIPITRWDEDDWGLVVETYVGSSNRNTIFKNIIPTAVTELYNILGTPYYKDTSWSSGNTIILEPISGYGLSSLREKRTVAVRNATDWFINQETFGIKLECLRLDV